MVPAPLDKAVNSKFFRDEKEKETFLRRLKRSLKRQVHQNSVEEFFQDALRIDTEQDGFPYSLEKLQRVTEENPKSKTAMGMLESAINSIIGFEALDGGDPKTAASALAEAYRKDSLVVRWDFSKVEVARESFQRLYSDPAQDPTTRAEALFVHANLLFLVRQFKRGLTQIKLAQRLLAPTEDPYFAASEGCILAMMMELGAAQKSFEKAAALGCPDPEHTLFHRAILPVNSVSDTMPMSLLEEYVTCAEPDARKLPEACYRLAMLHGIKGPKHMGDAKRFYMRGEKAEQDRTTLGLFRDEAKEWRDQAGKLVQRYHSCGRSECSSSATKNCSACAQVYYCSEACQRADWPSHKTFCKRHRRPTKHVD